MVVLDEFQRCEVSASITCRSYDRERPSTRRDRPPVVTVLPRLTLPAHFCSSVSSQRRSGADWDCPGHPRSAPQSRTYRDQRKRRSPKMRPMCQLTLTDAHHIWAWYFGGEANMENLLCRCRFHHVRVHEGRWRLALDPATGEVHVWRPDGTPYELGPSRPWTGPNTRRGDPRRQHQPSQDRPRQDRP